MKKQALRLLTEAELEWGTSLTKISRRPLTPEERERRSQRTRWERIVASHASFEEREAWRMPPVAPPAGVPGWACAHAVRVLWAAAQKGVDEANRWRGGWDSRGHWGLDSFQVQHAWDESRGHAGKFACLLRWQLRHPGRGYPLCLGRLSVANLRLVLSREIPHVGARVDARAHVALAGLPLAARLAALRGAAERAADEARARPGGDSRQIEAELSLGLLPVRRRHLDWQAAQAVCRQLRGGPPDLGLAVLADQAKTAGYETRADRWSAKIGPHPSYPEVAGERRVKLWLGVKPAELAPGLTAREAHGWLLDGAREEPASWLLRQAGLAYAVREIEVARWVIAVERDPARREALHREREIRDPQGRAARVVYATHADQITVADLAEGTRTSVQRAFERAAERFGRSATEAWSKDHRILAPIPRWFKPVRCARVLRTPAELVAEGQELSHCVGGYAPYVELGETVIVALSVRGERSTVEFSPDGRHVRQHHGASNSPPPDLCVRALAVLQRRWGTA